MVTMVLLGYFEPFFITTYFGLNDTQNSKHTITPKVNDAILSGLSIVYIYINIIFLFTFS